MYPPSTPSEPEERRNAERQAHTGLFRFDDHEAATSLRGIGEGFLPLQERLPERVVVELYALRDDAARLPTSVLRERVNLATRLLHDRPRDLRHLQEQAGQRAADFRADLVAVEQAIGQLHAKTRWAWLRPWRPRELRELQHSRRTLRLLADAAAQQAIRLRNHQADRHHWETTHRSELVRGQAALEELERRQERALDQLERDPPGYLLVALGAPPAGEDDTPVQANARVQWRWAARAIERYRAEEGVDDPYYALGHTQVRASWRHGATVTIIEQACASLEQALPDEPAGPLGP